MEHASTRVGRSNRETAGAWLILAAIVGTLGCASSPSVQLLYPTVGHSFAVVRPPPAPRPAPPTPDGISQEERDAMLAVALDQAVEHSGATGAAVAVVRGGKLAFSHATGVTRAGGAQVTDRTLFRIGSVGKFVTAIAAVQAARRGEVSLDASLAELLPGVARGITMRLLLSHQAGVPESASCEDGLDTPSKWASVHARDPLWSPPGALYNYSNPGVTMAAAVLERATSQPFPELVRDRVFVPSGMHGATYVLAASSPAHAFGHDSKGAPVADEPACGLNLAAGAAWMSAKDLAALGLGLMRADAPLVTSDDLAQILRKERSTTGADVDHAGLGIFLRQHRGRTIAYHGGTMNGFSAFFAFVPEEGFALAILVNATGVASFPGAAIDRYLPPREPLGPPPIYRNSVPRYVGTYSDPRGELGRFRIESVGDGVLRMVPLGGRRVDQFNDSFSGTFWPDTTGRFLYFATRWGVGVRVAD
jgi:CubicO group peptidase (beta-lactamase class C family)